MENPYQSPEEPFATPDRPRRGLVGHVRVVAILMIVQGGCEVFVGFAYGTLAAMMGPIMSQQEMQPQQGGPPPEQFFWMAIVIYGGMAAAALIAAVLHIVAGIKNCRFRGRILGIIALASGALTLFTCYCLPTAVGLGVYGLIVYLNGPASEAFRMGEAGRPANEILNTFQ